MFFAAGEGSSPLRYGLGVGGPTHRPPYPKEVLGCSHSSSSLFLDTPFFTAKPDIPFPAAKIRQAQTGDVAECRQIPKPVFGAGKRTPAETRPNNSQHHEIVRGRSENVANEGICRNERVALVFASFSLKKKKKSFPVSHCTKR